MKRPASGSQNLIGAQPGPRFECHDNVPHAQQGPNRFCRSTHRGIHSRDRTCYLGFVFVILFP